MDSPSDDRQTSGRISLTTGAAVLVELEGEFDHVNASMVMAMFAAIPPGDVTVDLTRVEDCSSSLLACLLQLEARVSRQGSRVHARLSPAVAHLLRTTVTRHPFVTEIGATVEDPHVGTASYTTV